MERKKELIIIFARCFKLIAKLSVSIDDGFFVDLLNQGSEKLLRGYIDFLKYGGIVINSERIAQTDALQHQDVAKCRDIVQHDLRVAQYRLRLISQIKSILKLLDILKHLGFVKTTTPLFLERDLLLLELNILNSRQEELPSGKIGKHNPRSKTIQTKPRTFPDFLSPAHKQIAQYITSRERAQNTEIFSEFSSISRRTLKRKLSELIQVGTIKRVADGKHVFYVENNTDENSVD